MSPRVAMTGGWMIMAPPRPVLDLAGRLPTPAAAVRRPTQSGSATYQRYFR